MTGNSNPVERMRKAGDLTSGESVAADKLRSILKRLDADINDHAAMALLQDTARYLEENYKDDDQVVKACILLMKNRKVYKKNLPEFKSVMKKLASRW
jgi:CCR4-NOT transcriptional regulation complex NOT5 subunit